MNQAGLSFLPFVTVPFIVIAAHWLARATARRVEAKEKGPLVVRPVKVAPFRKTERAYVVCAFRGLYGSYPRKFRGYLLRLTPAGLLLRPGLLARPWVPSLTITEELLSIWERPFENDEEARHFGAKTIYRPGGGLEVFGWTVIRCRTTHGLLDFAVQKREAAVLVAYLDTVRHRQEAQHEPSHPPCNWRAIGPGRGGSVTDTRGEVPAQVTQHDPGQLFQFPS